jgi:hypothetical protein
MAGVEAETACFRNREIMLSGFEQGCAVRMRHLLSACRAALFSVFRFLLPVF